MSYDNWKTDPEYEETRLAAFMQRQKVEAVRAGYGGYDRPAEAKMCAEANVKYRGKYNGERFEGIPEPERD